jgi:hypothetical protein
MDSDTRDVHPVLIQDYALHTPPIAKACEQVMAWVDSRVTGAYLYGLSRMGKSKAIKVWLPAIMAETYGDKVAVFRCIHGRQDRASQGAFVAMLARAVNHRYPTATSASKLERRLADFFVVQGLHARWHQVVLFVDEAQYMREAEYHVLCNLQNRADEASVRLTVITVGTHQLLHQKQAFILGSNIHLSTRFMARQSRFRGIATSEELRYVLDGYDSQSEWPDGSGTSYTRHFFARAFDQGLRLAHYAPALWEIFSDMAPPPLRPKLEVPMEYVAAPIEWIFRRMATEDPAFTMNHDLLRRAVRSTEYAAVMRTIATGRGLGQ